jgi:hypothetical protein
VSGAVEAAALHFAISHLLGGNVVKGGAPRFLLIPLPMKKHHRHIGTNYTVRLAIASDAAMLLELPAGLLRVCGARF